MNLANETKTKSEDFSPNRDLQCPKCSKVFSPQFTLNRHMVLHTGNFRWYCEECRKGFTHKAQYESHMRGHEGLMYRCESCGKGFTAESSLKYHLLEHTGNFKFKCQLCGKGFHFQPQFEKHVTKHK